MKQWNAFAHPKWVIAHVSQSPWSGKWFQDAPFCCSHTASDLASPSVLQLPWGIQVLAQALAHVQSQHTPGSRQKKRASQGQCVPKGVTPRQGNKGHNSRTLQVAISGIHRAAEHSPESAGSPVPVTNFHGTPWPALFLLPRPVSAHNYLVTFVTDQQLQPPTSL